MIYQATTSHGAHLNACCQVKKPILKGYRLYDSDYMTFIKGQDYRDSKKIKGFQFGRNIWNTGDLGEVKLFSMIP